MHGHLNIKKKSVLCVTIGHAFLGLMDRVSQKQQQHFFGGISICNEKSLNKIF